MANFWKSSLWQSVLDAGWAWTTLTWLLLAGAVLVFAWAMFRDRPGLWGIPRERCPRCRYDMAGRADDGENADDPIQCPECGKRVKHAKVLRKTRRRWGMALLALPLVVGWHLAERKEEIRTMGWLAAVPTVALIVMVDPQDCLDAGGRDQSRALVKPAKPNAPVPTLADHLHARLVRSEISMFAWLRWADGFLDREGYAVIDLSSIAPIERVTESNFMAYRSGPSWRSPGDLDDNDAESVLHYLTEFIDGYNWRSNGGDRNTAHRVGTRLLLRASPNTTHAAGRFISLLIAASSEPAEIREERIYGATYVAFSLGYFADTGWYTAERERWSEIGRTYAWSFAGGGSIFPADPGQPVVGATFAQSRFEWETSNAVREAMMQEVLPMLWVHNGGEVISCMQVNGITLIRCEDGWGQELFERTLERIRDLGPDAILAEHGVTAH